MSQKFWVAGKVGDLLEPADVRCTFFFAIAVFELEAETVE